MPIAHIIVPQDRTVYATCDGSLSMNEIRAAAAEIRRDPSFDPTFSVVIDLTAVTDFALGFPSLAEYVSAGDDPFAAGTRRAFVVSGDWSRRMAYMFQSVASAIDVRVFSSSQEAMGWINSAARAPTA